MTKGIFAAQVFMNGGPRGRPFKRLSAYVPQEDVFEPVLTAWETLSFHANLRLSSKVSKREKQDRMEDAIQTMGLSKSALTQVWTNWAKDTTCMQSFEGYFMVLREGEEQPALQSSHLLQSAEATFH